MATEAEHLILRGLSLLMRASFSPNEPAASAKHFMSLQNDIGPWLTDYAAEIAKPTEEAIIRPTKRSWILGGLDEDEYPRGA